MMGIGVLVSVAVAGISQLRMAQQSMSSLFVTAGKGGRALSPLGKAMVGVAAAAASMKIGMSALNATMDNIETYAEFEFQMAHLEGLLGRNRDEMRGFTDAAYDMAIASRYTASQSAEAMWEIASAGYEENEILEILPITAQAAAVGSMEMAEATDMLTSAMRSFQIPATEAEGTMDQMLTAMRLSKLHMDEFSSGFGRFGAVAAAANQDLSETLAIFGIFRTRGLSATRSATMVKMMLTHLMALSETEHEMMREMGVAIVNPMTGEFRDLLDIVDDLDRKLPQIGEAAAYGLQTGDEDVLFSNISDTAEERMRALVDIWGMRAVASFYAITTAQQQVNGVMYEGTEVGEVLARQIDSNTGATQDYYDSLLNTWQEQKRILKSTADLIKVLLGGALAQAIRPWLTQLQEWVGQIAEFLRAHPEVAKAIGYITLIAGVLLIAVGAMILIGMLIAGVVLAAKAAGAAIVFGIPAAILGLIALVIGSAGTIYTYIEEIKALATRVWEWVEARFGDSLSTYWKLLQPILKVLAYIMLGVLAFLAAVQVIVGSVIVGVVLTFLDLVWTFFETLIFLIGGIFGVVDEPFKKIGIAWIQFSEDLEAIWSGVWSIVESVWGLLRTIWGWVADKLGWLGIGGGTEESGDAEGQAAWEIARAQGTRVGMRAETPSGEMYRASGDRSIPRSGWYHLEEGEGVSQRGETDNSRNYEVSFGDINITLSGTGSNERDADEIARIVMDRIEAEMARVQ